MNIAYSEEAIEDLIRLREFIEIKNPMAAQRASASIENGISQLKEFPKIGTKVQFAPTPDILRDLIIGNYIARYLIAEDTIYILRIWHHRENQIPSSLFRRK